MAEQTRASQPTVIARPMRGDADFWRLRKLLIETVPITPAGFNWNVRRLDGKRFYNADTAWDPDWTRDAHLWETADGRLVGAVLAEGHGDCHPQLHPDFRDLEDEMIAWAEAHLAAPAAGDRRQLEIFVYEYDLPRKLLLAQRGFEPSADGGVTRRMHFHGQRLPPPTVAAGYRLRTTHPDDPADCQRMADLLNAAFGRDFHNAQEYQNFTRLAPSFRPDLDLVAEAPDGSLAAYVGVPYDEDNRLGIFEPVCTHPDHRRHGLAQALMREGLLRLQAAGAAQVLVDTGDMIPANRLYDSIGFTEVVKGFVWRKRW